MISLAITYIIHRNFSKQLNISQCYMVKNTQSLSYIALNKNSITTTTTLTRDKGRICRFEIELILVYHPARLPYLEALTRRVIRFIRFDLLSECQYVSMIISRSQPDCLCVICLCQRPRLLRQQLTLSSVTMSPTGQCLWVYHHFSVMRNTSDSRCHCHNLPPSYDVMSCDVMSSRTPIHILGVLVSVTVWVKHILSWDVWSVWVYPISFVLSDLWSPE